MQAYVMIECVPGTMKSVGQGLAGLDDHGTVKVLSSDAVLGPYDAIALLEGPDPRSIASFVVNVIQSLDGVERTQTMPAIRTA